MTRTTAFNRRALLLGAGASALTAACGRALAGPPSAKTELAFAGDPVRKITDAAWRERLPEMSYEVLRREATEHPGTSPLNKEKRKGAFVCLGCELPLFKSNWKYDSGTGWPSFRDKIKASIAEKVDADGERIEYHCARCLGHQGHVFEDGPPPTFLRYCNNGAALKFVPA